MYFYDKTKYIWFSSCILHSSLFLETGVKLYIALLNWYNWYHKVFQAVLSKNVCEFYIVLSHFESTVYYHLSKTGSRRCLKLFKLSWNCLLRICSRIISTSFSFWHRRAAGCCKFDFYCGPRYLGSDLWVRVSVSNWETFLRLSWCDSGWWRYQLNTNWWPK